MTQEEKQLLLQDLCARLPHETYILYDMDKKFDSGLQCCLTSIDIEAEYQLKAHRVFDPIGIEEARPYLRPMSSVTEEEEKELIDHFCNHRYAQYFDVCNKYHIDYRGLIEKGLAIEITEDNNPYEV